MEIISYNKHSLINALNEREIFNTDNHPITYQRAISYINNPRLDEDDIILVIAKSGRQLCGYIGIIPDYIFAKNKIKIGILSSWWVNPKFKNTGIGYIILLNASKSYDDKVYVSDFSKIAGAVYSKTKIFKRLESDYKTRIQFEIIGRKTNNKFFSLIKLFINKIYQSGSRAWFTFNKEPFANYDLVYADELINEDKNFIETFNEKSLFKRNVEEFNWFLKFPWVLESNDINENYYFSSNAKLFQKKLIKVF